MTETRPGDSALKNPRRPLPVLLPAMQGASLGVQYRGAAGGAVRGDFFDVVQMDPHHVLFLLLDLAAPTNRDLQEVLPVMAQVQEVFRQQAQELRSAARSGQEGWLARLVPEVNRGLIAAAEGAHSATAVLGWYDQQQGRLTYANAGAQPMLLRNGDAVRKLDATGVPLGLSAQSSYEVQTLALGPGAAVVIASRGVVEARRHEEVFGLDRVGEVLAVNADAPAQPLCDAVLQAAWRFRQQTSHFGPALRLPDFQQQHLDGDMTVVALARAAL
jgi:serine phosphatase RsbU (regulator of sigma subunit)